MIILASVALVLNLLDAVFTLGWVEAGMAEEANPIMAALLDLSPVAFMAGKLALVGAGVFLLSTFYERVLARVALVGTAGLYGAIVAYHLSALRLLAV